MHRSVAFFALAIAILAVVPARAQPVVTACNDDRQLADSIRVGGIVNFNCPGGDATIRISRTITIDRDVVINGGGHITLQDGSEPMFAAQRDGVRLELKDLKFKDTKQGIVRNTANASVALTVTGSSFTNCDAPLRNQNLALVVRRSTFVDNGGQVITASDDLIIEHSTFQGTKGAAAVFAFNSSKTTKIVDSVFTGNGSGALLIGTGSASDANDTVEINRSTFTNNGGDETGRGNIFGAIQLLCNDLAKQCKLTISSSRFEKNRAENGGAILVSGAALVSLKNVRFYDNTAKGEGGAIFSDPKTAPEPKLELQHAVLQGNKARVGGALRITASRLEGKAVTFAKNEATEDGGALMATDTAVEVARGVFMDNISGQRASISISGAKPSTFANALIIRNKTRDGAAFAGAGTRFVNSTIADNAASGIVHMPAAGAGPITLRNTIIYGNTPANCQAAGGGSQGPTPLPAGAIVDEGTNLEFPTKTCSPSITVAKPNLDTLYLPVVGSPAQGKGHNETCLAPPVSARDVYNKRRPQGKSCSIGAAEGDLEKEIADRTVGGPAWPGGLDRAPGTKPGGPGGPGQAGGPNGGKPGDAGAGTGCCCCCAGGGCR
jgi:predicted outer membrane repeat protein